MENLEKSIRRRKEIRQGRRVQKTKKILMVLLMGVLFYLIFIPIKNMITSRMVSYDTAEWGRVEQKIPVEAVIIRSEDVILAPVSGTFTPIILEGEKVPIGEVIGYINTQATTVSSEKVKIPVKAPKPGLVCYHPDGLEKILQPDMLDELDINKISSILMDEKKDITTVSHIESGMSILKLVDNLIDPYLYFKIPKGSMDKVLEVKDAIQLSFPNGEERWVTVVDKKIFADEIHLIVLVNNMNDLYLDNRYLSVEIIPVTYEGIIIPQQALVTRDDVTGIFYTYEGIVKWKEVKVSGEIGDEIVVRGLSVGNKYISNPQIVKLGQRIY